jgi:hypothetical protein
VSDLQPLSVQDVFGNPQGLAAASTGGNPDEAARAVQLGKLTGVPAPLVHNDVEGFEDRIKSKAAADITANNPQISRYLLSDPMAAKVSSDDYANLDAASEAMGKVAKPGIFQSLARGVAGAYDVQQSISKGFSEGFDWQGQKEQANQLYNLVDSPVWRGFVNTLLGPAAFGLTVTNQAFSGVIDAVAGGIGTAYEKFGGQAAYQQITGHPGTAGDLTRDLISMAQVAMAGEMGKPHIPPELNDIARAAQKAKPFIKSGKSVPVGVDPKVDELNKAESDADLKALQEAMKTSQKSATLARSPEYFQKFAEQHFGEDTVGVSAEAATKLYGDKIPEPGDNLLGFVSDMASQLELAKATGSDVQVPTADLLAHMDPEVFKAIEDRIRVRPEGITKGEEVPKPSVVNEPTGDPHTDAVNSLREASGLSGPEEARTPTPLVGFEKLFSNARNREVGTGPLPDWFDHVDATVQELATKLGLQTKPILWAGENIPGARTLGASWHTGDIVIRSDLGKNAAVNVAIHEFGHQMEYQKLDHETDDVKQAIQQAWKDSLRGREKRTWEQDRPVSTIDMAGKERTVTPYNNLFSEWFAEQVSRFITQKIEPQGIVEKFFKGIANAWRMIYERVTGYIDLTKEVDAFMKKNWHGDLIEEAGRRIGEPIKTPIEPPTPREPRVEQPLTSPLASGKAIDLKEVLHRRYMTLIEKQKSEYDEATLRRAVADERKRQTPEWNKNKAEVREEVATEVAQQPRYMADKALREGKLKLDADSLTDSQREGLPKEYITRGGEDPDAVGKIFGYDSGDAMIRDLQSVAAERGTMAPKEHMRGIIDAETESRMQARYGKLDQNIIEAAKDQILSITQLDILHAQLEEALSQIRPGDPKLPFTRQDVQAAAKKMVGDMLYPRISSDKLLATAGRAMRGVEEALLKNDPGEAFRLRQQHYFNIAMAREAMKVEKAGEQFKKIQKLYNRLADAPKLKGRDPEYVDVMHTLLNNIGERTKRSLTNAERSMLKNGYATINDFVFSKGRQGRSLFPPDFLQDSGFNRSINQLTGTEFINLTDFMRDLDTNARNEMTIWKGGERVDRQELINDMKKQLADLGPPKKYNPNPAERQTVGQFVTATFWRHINTESFTNRIDKGDWFGNFNQTIFRPAIEGANYIDRLAKEYNGKFSDAMSDIGHLGKKIENNLWKDKTGNLYDLNRGHLMSILQNVGNVGNRAKLFEGYRINEAVGMKWLWDQLEKEPGGAKAAVTRAQKFGKIFDELLDHADVMSRHENNNRGIDRIDVGKVQTPHGEVDGWYHPLHEDSLDNQYGIRRDKEALLQKGYLRSDAPQTPGYAKARTDAVYQIPLGLEIIPTRISQMIHDIAMRPAINQISKIVFDKEFASAVQHHYGEHPYNELKDWASYIANRQNYDSSYEAWASRVSDYFRSNMASTLIGANPGTIAKHGLTAAAKSFLSMPIAFSRELATLQMKDGSGERNWAMAMRRSDELARRFKNFQDIATRQQISVGNYRSNTLSIMNNIRSVSQWLGSYPIGFFDMMSSVPAWLATYKKAVAEGASEGDAVSLADRFVRQTHGSSVFVNKSGIARSSGLASWWTLFYNFFSENFQKQYETAWRIKDAYSNYKGGLTDSSMRNAKIAAGLFFTASILPSTIDMLFSSTGNKKESYTKTGMNLIAGAIGSGFIPVKDLLYALLNGRDPEGGLLSATMKEISDPIRDIASHRAFTPHTAGNFIKHFTGLMGLLTGVGNQTLGNAGKFLWDEEHGEEHPAGPWQETVGLRYGQTKGHTKSFSDWVHSEVPK